MFLVALAGYFTSLQANFSSFSSYAQLETFVFNKTCGLDSLSEKQRNNVETKQPSDPYKLYNPVYAIKSRILLLNMTVRIGIDKIDSTLWKRKLHTKSTIAGTITKALIAGPISVAQVVVDVMAHFSGMLVKRIAGIFKKSGTTVTENESTAQESQPISTLEMGRKLHGTPVRSLYVDHGKTRDIEMVTISSKPTLFSREGSKDKKKEGESEHPPVRPNCK